MLFTVALFALMAFAALALDGGNLYVARVELQNAADAGALAGARVLYNDAGETINNNGTTGYDPTARAAATSNFSQGTAAEVLRVRRGHWSFGTRSFTEIGRLAVCDLERTAAAIDADNSEATGCVNAVEVVTQRSDAPVLAFFGRAVGLDDYVVRARAVAYVGYAGSLARSEADQPIVICKQALQAADGGKFCSVGRFIPSSDTTVYGETGGYTDFEQEGACEGGTTRVRHLQP